MINTYDDNLDMIMQFSSNFNGGMISMEVSPEGNINKRNSRTNPYNYDTFIMIGEPNIERTTSSCYTDRLYQWDSKKYNDSAMEVFGNEGQFWSQRSKSDIEKFLKLYFSDETIDLVRVLQTCNHSSGYPLWVFEFNSDKKNVG